MWQQPVEFFAVRYRVITPDVIGFGGSQPSRPWTIPEMGQELASLLDHLRIETCTLAGLSMGGYIALPFALTSPSRVERLVLAHTRARADLETERTSRNAMIDELRRDLRSADGIGNLPEKMLPRLLGPDASATVRTFVKTSIERSTPEACIEAVTAMRDRTDQTAHLAGLKCPTLVVAGSGDAILKVEDCEKMASGIPHGKFVVIPRTGHLSNIEDPAAFNLALDRFLK